MRILRSLLNLFKGKSTAADDDEPTWALFTRSEGDRLSTVLFNTRFRGQPPPPELPIWIDVSVAFRDTDERGLPAPGELQRLAPLEDALPAAMDGAVQVGASAADGRRHWFFYSRTADAREAAERVLREHAEDSTQVRMREDPDWSMYRSRVCPTPKEERQMLDNMVLEALSQSGDIGDRERRIDHWAYFSSRAAADRFAGWATDHGFEVEAVTDPENDDDRFGVRFRHTGPALPGIISERTIAAQEAAAECGGEYDGWETFVVPE